ncbi:hypothetical protein EB796_014547 [Bugula neritina]|uniref:Uncharacterized protein n=1 Tax=Bugula neritina TaxID=10212 RepID=A0A7J7JNZ6_BUGNE|nr:hypothetical protein EB796_014547 [Bugula neritina]
MAGIDPTPPTKITAKCRFRAAVRAVTTMYRIKWLIARSKTLIRDVIIKPFKCELKSDSAKVSFQILVDFPAVPTAAGQHQLFSKLYLIVTKFSSCLNFFNFICTKITITASEVSDKFI